MNLIGFKISYALNSLQGETGQKLSYLHDELAYVKIPLSVDDSFVNVMETQVLHEITNEYHVETSLNNGMMTWGANVKIDSLVRDASEYP